jgi:asparagine synthase (glutamine-hydrolysing)
VTVALNGDGGDESFAGYNRYVSQIASHRLGRLPGWTRKAAARASSVVPGGRDPRSVRNRAKRLLAHSALDGPDRYALHMSFFDAGHRQRLYTPELASAVGSARAAAVIHDSWVAASGSDQADVMLETDVETYLPDDLLVKVDIASMAHSLEARSPLLDREVMEFAASLPSNWKLDRLQKKVALRRALRNRIPDRILDRPKMGFGVPLDHWFRGPLEPFAREVLDDASTRDRGYFRPEVVRSLIDDHVAGRADNSSRIWALLMLEMWHREFIDQP